MKNCNNQNLKLHCNKYEKDIEIYKYISKKSLPILIFKFLKKIQQKYVCIIVRKSLNHYTK